MPSDVVHNSSLTNYKWRRAQGGGGKICMVTNAAFSCALSECGSTNQITEPRNYHAWFSRNQRGEGFSGRRDLQGYIES